MALPTTPFAATALGVLAPVCWGCSVSLMRAIVEEFGVAPGECLLYAIATVYLYFTVGLPDFSKMRLRYWIFGIGNALACSLTLVFSIYLSTGGKQTMEVGMINYLWPAMTILFAVLFTGQKADWRLWPGMALSVFGIFWILSGGEFSFTEFAQRFLSNPWSYVLAFFGALTWVNYTTVTKLWSEGQNPSTVVFALLTLIYAGLWALGVGEVHTATIKGAFSSVFGGFIMASAYVLWTNGVQHGRISILSIASYFTPVLSCVIGVFWIDARLTGDFWAGVAVLTVGSLLCWRATRTDTPSVQPRGSST